MIQVFQRFFLFALLFSVLIVSACARYDDLPPGTVLNIESSAVVDLQEVSIETPFASEDEIVTDYLVGPGDVLAINIPGLVEQRRHDIKDFVVGFRVYSSGNILLPLVGGVQVAGQTVEEIQQTLQEVFTPYIKKPAVTVEILEFKSQPLYLLGKFNKPGVYYLDRPTLLLHGIALGSGMFENANLRGARLVRSDRILPVDIYRLLYNNDLSQNVQLRSGDTIYLPGNEDENVFVFGAVKKGGPVPMHNGRLTLIQALTHAGLNGGGYDQSHIRVIRSLSPTKGQLLVFDLNRVMNGRALPPDLMNGDIVYVPKSATGNWNEALSELLPTLQAVSATLAPFVQLKYLSDDDD